MGYYQFDLPDIIKTKCRTQVWTTAVHASRSQNMDAEPQCQPLYHLTSNHPPPIHSHSPGKHQSCRCQVSTSQQIGTCLRQSDSGSSISLSIYTPSCWRVCMLKLYKYFPRASSVAHTKRAFLFLSLVWQTVRGHRSRDSVKTFWANYCQPPHGREHSLLQNIDGFLKCSKLRKNRTRSKFSLF